MQRSNSRHLQCSSSSSMRSYSAVPTEAHDIQHKHKQTEWRSNSQHIQCSRSSSAGPTAEALDDQRRQAQHHSKYHQR
jgi:hypothetical protein